MYITFKLCVSHWSNTNITDKWLIMSLSRSTHQPWRSPPAHSLQPGAHTPISHSTLLVFGPCGASGSPVQAASRPRCSAVSRRFARHGTRTGTYNWGRTSGRSGRQSRPQHTHLQHDLEDRYRHVSNPGSRVLRGGIASLHIRLQTVNSPAHTPVLLWTSAV